MDRMDFASSVTAGEDRSGCKGIVVKSSVVPNDLARMWDRTRISRYR